MFQQSFFFFGKTTKSHFKNGFLFTHTDHINQETSDVDTKKEKNADNIHLLKDVFKPKIASYGDTAFLFHFQLGLTGVIPLPHQTHMRTTCLISH